MGAQIDGQQEQADADRAQKNHGEGAAAGLGFFFRRRSGGMLLFAKIVNFGEPECYDTFNPGSRKGDASVAFPTDQFGIVDERYKSIGEAPKLCEIDRQAVVDDLRF